MVNVTKNTTYRYQWLTFPQYDVIINALFKMRERHGWKI